tara:strand:- start:585 stop:1979 length:1395 start_codon:yes stop_codon:yes gene_type:complete
MTKAPQIFDFIVIGGGSAGFAGARTAVAQGKRVAIVDGSETLGGLCILRGCMPSKTLIYAAEVLHHAKHGKTFGLDIPTAKIDIQALHKRKKAIIEDFASYRQEQLGSKDFTVFRSNAHFTGPNTVELDDGTELKGEKFLIATGSVISEPDVPGLAHARKLTSDEILDLDYVPESVVVLGGGIVACELGQFLRRIGSRVIMIQRSKHILKETSSEAASVVEQAFRDEGIELYTDTAIQQITQGPDGVHIRFHHQGKRASVEAKYLVNALGRKPATTTLDLEAAGIQTKPSGHIEANRFQQTTNPNIYAAGDCTGPHEIVHIAILQGECAAKHAGGHKPPPMDYDHVLKVIFTDPQVAQVGLSEKEIQKRNIPYVSAEYPFNDHGKSILMEAHYGYVKIFANKDMGCILGAECVGRDASELIHPLSVAVALEASASDMLKAHWYHPTLSEIWTYPLEEIAEAVTS